MPFKYYACNGLSNTIAHTETGNANECLYCLVDENI